MGFRRACSSAAAENSAGVFLPRKLPCLGMMISGWTLWDYHELRLHDVYVPLPILESLLCLGEEDVMIRMVSLLDLSEDVVIRLVLDLSEDVVARLVLLLDLGEDRLVVLVSTYYHLLARNVSWTGLAFCCHSPFLNPCLSHHHHCHHLRSVRRSRSSLLVAST
jgi:hypothetical protein